MKFAHFLSCAALLPLAIPAAAQAADFKSVGAEPAIMYDAPSQKGRKVFIAPRDMPVEVVLTYGEWSKVRDAAGDLSWVESKALTQKRQLLALANTRVRAAADETSPVVFTADKGVLLEMAEPMASGWLKVRHRDGQGGFVKAADVWGE